MRDVLIGLLVLVLFTGCSVKKKEMKAIRVLNSRSDIALIAKPQLRDKTQKTYSKANLDNLTLKGAISYALQHNFDAAVSAYEEAIERQQATGAIFNLLPSLILDAERSKKSKHVPSRSENYVTKATSVEPSISSELKTEKESANLTWDLLNLTINIYRWEQAEYRAGMAGERLRRVRQDIVMDVTRVYMRAVVAMELLDTTSALLSKVKNRLATINNQMQSNLVSEVEGLNNTAKLIDLQIRMKRRQKNFLREKAELKRLLGLPLSHEITLAKFKFSSFPEIIDADFEVMSGKALLNRPEFFERDLEEKISKSDAKIALIQMFPSLTPFVRYEHDQNRYLDEKEWLVSGLKLSWSMFSIPGKISARRLAHKRAINIKQRRKTLGAAILTQLRLAIIDYKNVVSRIELAKALSETREKLKNAVEKEVLAGKSNIDVLLDREDAYYKSRLSYLATYAELVNAEARINNTLGMDWNE